MASSLLTSHLEQISLCATSIADLPFPAPKIFTNALLSQHDITSLIRDTEAHERALFHLAPPPLPGKPGATESSGAFGNEPTSISTSKTPAKRRATVYGNRQPKSRAVAAVLGGDLYSRTRQEETNARVKGEMDVDVLLEGAERLLAVYAIPGAADRIAQLRRRHAQLAANIRHYEQKVNEQTQQLARSSRTYSEDEDDDEGAGESGNDANVSIMPVTKEDLEAEEAEIKELERKKQALEERVTGMERDLGGLMR